MMRRSPRSRPLFAGMIVLFVLVALGTAQAALLSRLPAGNEIRGWGVITGGDRVAADQKGLYSLYDGAAPDMMKQGIALASQRIYKKGNKRLTIDVYKFATAAQARAYYNARKAEIARSKAFWSGGCNTCGVARAISGRTHIAYLWQKQLCCTMSVNGTTDVEKSALEAFAASINKKIAAQP